MNRAFKWLAVLGVLFLVIHLPVMTEYEVQKVKWHLNKDKTLKGLKEKFGKPSRVYSDGGETLNLHGVKTDLMEGEELWVYNREGIPNWVFVVITSDGETISRHYVDRFW